MHIIKQLKLVFSITLLLSLSFVVQSQDLHNIVDIQIEGGTRSSLTIHDDFTVIKDQLFICRSTVESTVELEVYQVNGQRVSFVRSLSFNGFTSQIQPSQDGLVIFDKNKDSRKLFYLNKNLEIIREIYPGMSFVSEAAKFKNGNLIIHSDQFYVEPMPLEEFVNDLDKAYVNATQSVNYEHNTVFLVDDDFRLLSPLMERYKGIDLFDKNYDLSNVDTIKFGVLFRLNQIGTYAAVFNQHRDDIQVIGMNGEKILTINRTRAGMQPDPDQFPYTLNPGDKVWYQSDVLLDGDMPLMNHPAAFTELYLYVSEPRLLKLDVYKITGFNQSQWLGSIQTPSPVMRMVKSIQGFKSYLYMTDRDGNLTRSDFPNPVDLAPAFKK